METEAKRRIRLLLVDDHPFVIEGLRFYLAAQPQFEIVGEAANGREAIVKARELKPDIILLDISMPDMNGLEAAAVLFKQHPEIKVLVLSAYDNQEYVLQVVRNGARGFVPKDASPTELARAIEALDRGETYFSPAVSKVILEAVVHGTDPERPPGVELSQRELEVLRLIAEGHSNKEIAFRLGIGVRTIETHRERIMQKLDIHTIAGLTRFAIANKLIQLNEGHGGIRI